MCTFAFQGPGPFWVSGTLNQGQTDSDSVLSWRGIRIGSCAMYSTWGHVTRGQRSVYDLSAYYFAWGTTSATTINISSVCELRTTILKVWPLLLLYFCRHKNKEEWSIFSLRCLMARPYSSFNRLSSLLHHQRSISLQSCNSPVITLTSFTHQHPSNRPVYHHHGKGKKTRNSRRWATIRWNIDNSIIFLR